MDSVDWVAFAYWMGVLLGIIAVGAEASYFRRENRRLRRLLKWCAAHGATLEIDGQEYAVLNPHDVLLHRDIVKARNDYYAGTPPHLIEPHTGQGAAARRALRRWNKGSVV